MVNPPSSRGGSSFPWLCLLLATGFNLGRIPYAPGTVGSLGALLVFLPFRNLPWTFHLSVVALLFAVGTYAANPAALALSAKDPPIVIIDEIVGCWVALLAIPPRPAPLLCAFALFRLFDIWKPFPAGRAQNLSGGWGIMLDDLVAGVYANLSVGLLRSWLPELIG